MVNILGTGVDDHGRCVHYHGHRDVIANFCATCEKFFACHLCHDELADHPFGRVRIDARSSVLCGACGHTMGYSVYSQVEGCPRCAHPFNPGCSVHAPLYFHLR